MSEEVNKRNILALAEHMKRIDVMSMQADERSKHLEAQIAQLNQKVQVMEQYVTFLRIKFMGSGPTA